MSRLSEFLFEAAALKRTPRTGYQFLGRGRENVAEHSFGATSVAYVLGRMSGQADMERLLLLTLFHDLPEARTGDLNYVNKRYVVAREEAALAAAAKGLPFADELVALQEEWLAGDSLEAGLAADADQLDMILELKRLHAHGWRAAGDWLTFARKRLKTAEGRILLEQILDSDPDDWWFEKKEELWVNPKKPFDETRQGRTKKVAGQAQRPETTSAKKSKTENKPNQAPPRERKINENPRPKTEATRSRIV
ncbi:MAG: HD domain-containing protein, partial [Deltaproteobacteria bacterium]|nr:HD domain-containing protein [Deltaproteobacteria bacterium]